MKLISLCLLFSFAVGCVRFNEKTSRFPGQREKKTHKRTRLSPTASQVTAQPADTSQVADSAVSANQNTVPKSDTESLIFPFRLSAGHNSLLLKSSDNEKISFSVKPDTQPFTLIAGLSGTVSLNTQNGTHYLSLTPNQGSQILHFELSEEGSAVETSDQAKVSQRQVLMKSNKPIVFYITENSEPHSLCINTSSIEKILTVVKELPETEACL